MASADKNPTGREFNSEELQGFLAELDDLLVADGANEKIALVIVGGAAMSALDPDRLTRDVDVLSEGMTPQLRQFAAEIGRRHGLRPDWLNDAAKLFASGMPVEGERIFEGQVLRVDSAGPRYVLAMKLARGRAIDDVDCEFLIRALQIHSHGELMDLIEQFVPPRLRTPRMGYYAADQLEAAWKGHTEPT